MANVRDILYRFTADVSDYKRKTKGLTDSLGGVGKQAENMAGKIQGVLNKTGIAMTLGVTAPLMALGGVAQKSAMEMETAMTGVAKTTDLSAEEIKNLTRQLQEMSHKIPVASTELANIAETAGQLGIKKEHLLDFTRVMADLGVATNMNSVEAANSLARLANITGMSQTDFDRLGSSVVELGNNLATTEGEIVDMSLRLAGTGSVIGLSEAQIMGLAGAMSSMGINAQAGGSAMSQTMQTINSEVLSGGENVEKFAKIAGMSASEFSDVWKNDPIVALEAFIGGLGEINEAGGDVSGTLKDLEINGLNQVDVLSRLSGNSDILTEAVKMSTDAWDENTALSDEATTAYETTANQIEMVRNRIETLSQRIGALLLPGLNKMIDVVENVLDKLVEMDEEQLQVIVTIGKFVAAIGPILIILSKLIGFAVSTWDKFSKLNSAFKVVSGGAGILTKAGGLLILKFVAIGVAIAAVIAAGVWLYKNWDTVTEKARELGQKVAQAWESMKTAISEKISEIWESIKSWFSELGPRMTEGWTNMVESAKAKWEEMKTSISEKITEIWTSIVEWTINMVEQAREMGSQFLEGVLSFFRELPDQIMYWLGFAIGFIGTFVAQSVILAIKMGSDFVTSIIDWFKQLPEKVSTWVSNTYEKVSTWATNMWNKAKELGKNFITSMVEWFTKLPGRIKEKTTEIWNNIVKWSADMWNKAKETAKNFYNSMVEWFTQLPGRIQSYLSDLWNRITTWSSNMWSKAKETGRNFINGIIEYVRQLPSKIQTWLSDTLGRITTWGSNLYNRGKQAGLRLMNAVIDEAKKIPSRIKAIGGDVVRGFWNGITNLGGWLKGKVSSFFRGIVDGAKSALKIFSPSRVFEDEVGKMVVLGFGRGIDRNDKEAINPMRDLVDDVLGVWDGGTNDLKAQVGGMIGGTIGTDINMTENFIPVQSATMNFTFGNRSFKAFVEDISSVESENIRLEEVYSLA